MRTSKGSAILCLSSLWLCKLDATDHENAVSVLARVRCWQTNLSSVEEGVKCSIEVVSVNRLLSDAVLAP